MATLQVQFDVTPFERDVLITEIEGDINQYRHMRQMRLTTDAEKNLMSHKIDLLNTVLDALKSAS